MDGVLIQKLLLFMKNDPTCQLLMPAEKGSFGVIFCWWEWQGGGRGSIGCVCKLATKCCCWRRWDPPDSTLTHLFMPGPTPSHPQSLAPTLPTTKQILFSLYKRFLILCWSWCWFWWWKSSWFQFEGQTNKRCRGRVRGIKCLATNWW